MTSHSGASSRAVQPPSRYVARQGFAHLCFPAVQPPRALPSHVRASALVFPGPFNHPARYQAL
eukprot:7702940-Alexandrium_andersonii.AAC.1